MGACGRTGGDSGKTTTLLDLVAELEHAQVRTPTRVLDLGRSSSWPHLARGWHRDRVPLDAAKTLWGRYTSGDISEAVFYVADLQDRELAFSAAHLLHSGSKVGLFVNDHSIASLELSLSQTEYRAPVPAAILHEGLNVLRIENPPASQPRQGSKDVRTVWQWIRFDIPGEPTRDPAFWSPRADSERHLLEIPAGTRIDYFADLPARSDLRADGLSWIHGATLGIEWTTAGGRKKSLLDRSSDSELSPQRLVGNGPETGRLSLIANSVTSENRARVVIERPLVSTTEPEPVSDDSTEETGATFERSKASLVSPPLGGSPNIVLYMIDTLRADHLGCYGYSRNTSPAIDRFAENAILFESAQAQTPWTRASVASVLTGLWPQVHGTVGEKHVLSPQVNNLAESLQDVGYKTIAVIANGNVNQIWGFDRGFDRFIYLQNVRPGTPLARSTDVHSAVLEVLDEIDGDQPFFLWSLTIDPHTPYEAPEPFHSRFSDQPRTPDIGSVSHLAELANQETAVPTQTREHLVDLYDAEIAANDHSFGQLVDALENRDLFDESLVILVSDHGEEFNEHGGWEHGRTLHSEVLDVPLIIKPPGHEGAVQRNEVAQHVDLAPTILDLAGAPPLAVTQGHSLVPLLDRDEHLEWAPRALAHLDRHGLVMTSMLDDGWKVIIQRHEGVDAYPSVFHWESDRRELFDHSLENPFVDQLLTWRLHQEVGKGGEHRTEPDMLEMEELGKTEEQLRALGYL